MVNLQGDLPTVDPLCVRRCLAGLTNEAVDISTVATEIHTPDDVANPNIVAACTPEAEDCYCATPSTAMNCVDTVVAGVWKKGGGMTPAGKVINFKCAGY